MSVINRSGEPEPVVRSANQQKKKKEVNLQELAERILRLLKKEARLERERQGPR